MKKILAVLLALSMMCVMFAACGSKEEETTTTTEEEISYEDEGTSAADEETTAAEDETAAEESTEAVTDENGETVSAAAEEETTAEEEDPSTWDTAKIVEYYNAARANTPDTINGHQTMALSGEITGDGAIGTILKVLQPAAKSALEKNSKDLQGMPGKGHADIQVSDVKSATAKKDAKGNIVITMYFNDQTDGPNGDDKNGGPVARGVGTLGSIDTALSELGAEITEGRDTVTLKYTNAYAKDVVINPKTNQITKGTFHYLVNVNIKNAKAKLSIVSATLENLKAAIDYTRTVG